MLLNIYSKSRVKKIKVVHAIELGYIILLQNSDLIIIATTGTTADNIGGSTIHTSLTIDVKNRHRTLNAISNLWTTQDIMIVDKINMVKLEILSKMGKQLVKAHDFSNSSRAVFYKLLIVIIMRDVYQFFSIIRRPLWGKP